MAEHLDEYYRIMLRYKLGEFGEECLSMRDILERAGKPNLLDEMDISELRVLADSSHGITKRLFNSIIKQKRRQT